MTYYDDSDYKIHIGYDQNESITMDIDEYSLNTSNGGSIDSNIKKQKKMIQDIKKLDKGYHCVKRNVNVNDTIVKMKIEYYHTNYTPGTKIRNAITGERHNYLVGSRDEDLFFKAVIANGEDKSYPLILFYDGPNEFQKHQHCILSDDIIEKWRSKNDAERYRRKEIDENKKKYGMVLVN